MASTITIQQVVNLASIYTELIPYTGVGGISNEPALTIANETMEELLGYENPWKFNRKEMPSFFTMEFRQTYQFAGASAFGLDSAKGVGIDLASNNAITESGTTVTVQFLDPHNFSVGDTMYMTGNTVAAYNSVFTQSPSNGSAWSGGWVITAVPDNLHVQFTHASSGLANSGAPGITDFGWLESATMVDPADTAPVQGVKPLTAVRMLEPASTVIRPQKIAMIQDLNNGVLRFRFNTVPGSNRLQVFPVYQMKPTLLTSLSSTWAPFPDEFSYVYRQMFLAQAYRFAKSALYQMEYQKAQMAVNKGLGRDDREQAEEYMVPDSPIGTGDITQNGVWWL